jgi:hypothetical protein
MTKYAAYLAETQRHRAAVALAVACLLPTMAQPLPAAEPRQESPTLNQRDDGYRGIWYMNQPSQDEYVYKYSGGLGTYCAHHAPFAIYAPQANKTFFCFGGATATDNRRLVHMISYYDHKTHRVPRPTRLLDKKTSDAHDNPVISLDDQGHIWIFSTSHGTSRPSYVHRSRRPYDVSEFERVPAQRTEAGRAVPLDNFSYVQMWHVPREGFVAFFTKYNYPVNRTSCFMTSKDGVTWNAWQRLAAIEEGHYQVSAAVPGRAGAACNYHPTGKGVNWRTNLYYLETRDNGATWQNASGQPLAVPLTQIQNAALVHDYRAEGLNVYLMDMIFDAEQRPIILYLTSSGYESGPKNDPRRWTTARWTGTTWDIRPAMTSDSNYDMGSLWLAADGTWHLIAPTATGPQAYNPGGEIVWWTSRDQGANWEKKRQLTSGSPRNHTYVRRPINAHPDFFAIWADGDARQPSISQIYFCDDRGNVRVLPRTMDAEWADPQLCPTTP